jgi:hypothetical protein
MPISSPLAPEVIVGNKPKSVKSAQSFISGGAPLGTSVVSSAANKIVGFQRAGVRPVTPDINSIVKSISSNILNQVNSTIQSVTNLKNREMDAKLRNITSPIVNQIQQLREGQGTQVTQLQNVVQNIRNQTTSITQKLLTDYKDRVQKVDAAKPTNILGSFLDTFKNALGFIKFFGNQKNIEQLTEALQNLKRIFLDSFEVAKLVRKTIVKIVKQLSDLPKTNPQNGGLNLDVNVPQGAKGKTKIPRFAKAAGIFGLGALGAAAGTTAVNALSDVQPQQVQSPSLMGDFGDRFSQVVDKFVAIIESLAGKKDQKKTGGSGGASQGGGGGGSPKSPTSPGSSMPTGPSTLTPGDAPPEIKAIMDAIASTEGTWDSVNYGKGSGKIEGLENMSIDQALAASDEYRKKYGGTGTLGRYQHHPKYLRQRAIDAGLDPKTAKFTKENQSLIQRVFLDKTFGGEAKLVDMVQKKDWQGLSKKLGEDIGWPSLPGGSQSQPGYTYQQFGGKIEAALKHYHSLKPATAEPDKGMGGLGVDPSMLDLETKTLAATKIAQPPPSQAKPSIVTLPIDMGGGGTMQKPAPEIINPPAKTSGGTYTAPLLGSSHEENFFTVYSKIVFNIVDG